MRTATTVQHLNAEATYFREHFESADEDSRSALGLMEQETTRLFGIMSKTASQSSIQQREEYTYEGLMQPPHVPSGQQPASESPSPSGGIQLVQNPETCVAVVMLSSWK